LTFFERMCQKDVSKRFGLSTLRNELTTLPHACPAPTCHLLHVHQAITTTYRPIIQRMTVVFSFQT